MAWFFKIRPHFFSELRDSIHLKLLLRNKTGPNFEKSTQKKILFRKILETFFSIFALLIRNIIDPKHTFSPNFHQNQQPSLQPTIANKMNTDHNFWFISIKLSWGRGCPRSMASTNTVLPRMTESWHCSSLRNKFPAKFSITKVYFLGWPSSTKLIITSGFRTFSALCRVSRKNFWDFSKNFFLSILFFDISIRRSWQVCPLFSRERW